MFGNWFAPKWKQRNVRARLSAVKNLSNNAEQQQILQQLALQDPDATVRHAAQQQLNAPSLLLQISQQDSDANNRDAAQQRLHQHLCEQPFEASSLKLLAEQTPASLLKLAQEAQQIELCQAALQRLNDEEQLSELTLTARFSQIRQQAAARIQQPARLETLIKTSKSRDKKVHQQLKQRLKQLKEQEQQQHAEQQLRLELCQELENHSATTYSNVYPSKLEKIVRHWQRLERPANDDLQTRFKQAQQACLERIQQQQHLAEQADKARDLAQKNRQQQKHEQVQLAQQKQQQQQTQQQYEAQRERKKNQQQQKHTQLSDKLQQLAHALEAGNLAQSNQRHKEIERLNRELGSAVTKAEQQQFQQLNARHQELRDWQGFATTPKKESLCQQMEALIEIDLPADELAEQINSLQTQWKKLGASDPKTSQPLWLRFKGAADQAYEPCKTHFAQQQQQRQQNLKKRQQLCEQLQQFIQQNRENEQATDWQVIEKVIRVAKQEWSNYREVQRGRAKNSQIRFNKLLKILQDQLDSEREKNTELKQKIVERAQQLIEQENLSDAMQEAKQLQKKWQAIGTTFYKQDRQLWKQFRSACDAIFARKDQQNAAEQALLTQHQQQAEELIATLEQLSQEQTPANSGLSKMQQLQQQFDDLGELPKAAITPLQQRFENAQQAYQHCCLQQQQQQLIQQQQQLRQQAQLCQQLEQINSPVNKQELLQDLIQQWQNQHGNESILNKRFQHAVTSCQNSHEEQLQQQSQTLTPQRQQLCIQLEILLGVDSPTEDQALRMQYQVNRLSQGLNQKSHNPLSNQQQLEEQWFCLGPLTDPESLKLERRFQHALQAASQSPAA
ncbi:MAG: DUF349 domain-containing protein [Gammaproteobacteria bacterium]|nr:DUF349 domain-containing protein [Gammaproteobacteria bacterium]